MSGTRSWCGWVEITDTNTFYPWVRLYSPGGTLLGSSYGAAAAEVSTTAASSGTFIVVVGDGNGGLYGSGDYRLTLAKMGSPVVVTPGDEGGAMTNGINPTGVISVGDIDVWTFTICKGENINLRVDELIDNGGFTPWLRLYGPAGAILGSISGATSAQLNLTALSSGTFTALVCDGNGALSGTGTYQLTSNGLSYELRLCAPIVSGTNLNLSGVGGESNAVYTLYMTTNLATPLAFWTPIRTNQFDLFGVCSHTNLYDPARPQQFFILRAP